MRVESRDSRRRRRRHNERATLISYSPKAGVVASSRRTLAFTRRKPTASNSSNTPRPSQRCLVRVKRGSAGAWQSLIRSVVMADFSFRRVALKDVIKLIRATTGLLVGLAILLAVIGTFYR